MKHREQKERPTALEAAVRFADLRQRTVKQVREHLQKLDYCTDDIDYAVSRLEDALMLNDEKYACDYVQTRLAAGAHSRRELGMQLRQRGIPAELADAALMQLDSEDELNGAIQRAKPIFAHYKNKGDENKVCVAKTVRRLVGYGYDSYTAKLAARGAEADSCDD